MGSASSRPLTICRCGATALETYIYVTERTGTHRTFICLLVFHEWSWGLKGKICIPSRRLGGSCIFFCFVSFSPPRTCSCYFLSFTSSFLILFFFCWAGCVGPPTTTMRHGHLIDECLTDLVTGCRLQDAPLREQVISILPRSLLFRTRVSCCCSACLFIYFPLVWRPCLNISPLSDVSGRPRITQPSTRRLAPIWSSPDRRSEPLGGRNRQRSWDLLVLFGLTAAVVIRATNPSID